MFYRFVKKHTCDGQTDGRTDGQTDRQNYDLQDRSNIAASSGNNKYTL